MGRDDMENILRDINAVVGVTGSFVCNDEGQMVAKLMPEVFDDDLLSPVGRTMAQTIAGLKIAQRRKVGDIDLLYDGGRLIVKNVGEGCLCILCVTRINVPLLNLTANVTAKKLANTLKTKSVEAKPVTPPLTTAEALKVMSGFTDLLVEELGDRGLGRSELLHIVERRLERLKTKQPLLESIVIDGERIDVSPLQSSSPEEIGETIAALIKAICHTCLGTLGTEVAQNKYRQVYESFYRQNEKAFDHLRLGRSLEKATTFEKSALTAVELRF
jgi:predicted regulator of Ras-like GTPase activity (Roadblock/LC7/MglB family)